MAPARIAGVLALVAAGPACSEPTATGVVPLIELASDSERAHYSTSAPRTPDVLVRGADLDWTAVARPAGGASEAERALFDAHAVRDADGALRLGEAGGAWIAFAPIDPETELVVSALAEMHGLHPGPSRPNAQLVLVELSKLPERLDLAALKADETARHWATPLRGSGRSSTSRLLVRTASETRAIGLLLFLTMAEPTPGARLVWRDVSVTSARPQDHLRAASDTLRLDDGGTLPPLGAFTVAGVRRPSLGLVDGDRVELDVRVPESGSTLELFAAIPPSELGGPLASAELLVDVSGARAGAPTRELARLAVENTAGRPPLWHRLEQALPADLAGERVTLRFESRVTGGTAVTLAIGTPRLVPDRLPPAAPRVVLVSIDTLRADRLGTYGGPPAASPNLDALADEALVFEQAWSCAPYTLPSHVSMLSGQLPGVHGVQRPGNRIDGERTRMLAELLSERGYATGAFTGGGYTHPDFGFAAGFDRYGTIDPVCNLESAQLAQLVSSLPDRDMELVAASGTSAAVDWLERHADEPFFLFFHTYITHQFDPAPSSARALGYEPLNEADLSTVELLFDHRAPDPAQRARLLELYDATVHQADAAVGELIAALKALELWDETLFVVTSDHGKELGEHGAINHGHSLHRELLHVPLLVRAPGVAPARRDDLASGIDVLPTVLEFLELPLRREDSIQGRSLLSLPPERALFAEVENLVTGFALQEGELKTIVMVPSGDPFADVEEVEERSYDLALDPLELDPLPPDPERARRVLEFGAALRALRASLGGSGAVEQALDPATRSQLEGLGYAVGAGD